jgi:ABC-type bacteriocin/lantibiotic exporter with double-glycine peptidase domain
MKKPAFDPKSYKPKFRLLRFLLRVNDQSHQIMTALAWVEQDVRAYNRAILGGAVLIFLEAILMLPLPFVMGAIIDEVLPGKDIGLLLVLVGSLALVNLIGSLIGYVQKILFFKVNNKMIIDLQKRLFDKLNRMPIFMSQKLGTGYLMSRVKDDPPRLAALFGEQILQQVKQFFVLIVSLIALFYIHWRLALLVVAILPLFLYTVHYFGKKIRQKSQAVFERMSLTSRSLQENIDMVELCKSFCRESFNSLRYAGEMVKTYRSMLDLKKVESLNFVALGFIGAMQPLSVLAFGGYLIINSLLTIGMLVAFMTLMNNVVGPASSLISFNIEIQKIKVALSRVGEILSYPEESNIKPDERLRGPVGKLCIDRLMFSYDGKNNVLENIAIRAEKGEKIGIVGASGSGKTSLVRALAGMHGFAGNIVMNGFVIGDSNKTMLRHKVAVVPQEPFLFNDTVHANVAFGKTDATDKEVRQALKQANAWEFIKRLPEQEQSLVGEKGGDLSVGQKQRLSIARALVKNADILILDEATSNVDAISSRMIAEAICRIATDRIVFVIDHKFDLVTACDKIIVLANGRITEQGTHAELLTLKGLYAKLHQSANFVPSDPPLESDPPSRRVEIH